MTTNVESLNSKNEKVVSLNSWKQNREQISEAKVFSEYLSTLNLDALIEEVKVYMREIEEYKLENHHVKRGKLIMDEISNRVASSSPEMAKSILLAKETIAEGLKRLGNLEVLD